MKLYYAKPSPYARRVRVLLRERGLRDRIQEIELNPWDSPAELLAVNPGSRVPVLVSDDGVALGESPLIALHLDSLGERKPLLPDASETRLLHTWGVAEALTSAAWLAVVEGRRDERLRSAAWLSRQHDAIVRCLAVLESDAAFNDELGFVDIVLAVCLGYLDLRLPAKDWRTGRPKLTDWYARMAQRPSMVETPVQ